MPTEPAGPEKRALDSGVTKSVAMGCPLDWIRLSGVEGRGPSRTHPVEKRTRPSRTPSRHDWCIQGHSRDESHQPISFVGDSERYDWDLETWVENQVITPP